jgi:hypothetical protein
MTILSGVDGPLGPRDAASLLADFGFLAHPDLPNRPGPARLLVAIRPAPTLRHYDPELVEYWVSRDGRGRPRELTGQSPMPVEVDVSWGVIRIVDRLRVSNEYLTFGGHLSADRVGDAVVGVVDSPAPLLRRGGHSQGWDRGAEQVGAFFGRLLLAVDLVPGFEQRLADVTPLGRFAAFLVDAAARYRASPTLRADDELLWPMLRAEERRLRTEHPRDWAAGPALRREMDRVTEIIRSNQGADRC